MPGRGPALPGDRQKEIGMQGIGKLGGIASPAAARTGARRGPGGFHVEADGSEAAREARAAGSIAPANPGLLALQEAGSEAGRDEAAERRATDILEELNALQCDLLKGVRGDPARLRDLLESGEEGSDPALREVVRGVLLRAEVELVRRSLGADASIA